MPTVWILKKKKVKTQVKNKFYYFVMLCLANQTASGQESSNPDASVKPLTALTAVLKEEHLILTLEIKGKKFEGLIDSGADISVIFTKLTPIIGLYNMAWREQVVFCLHHLSNRARDF